MQCDDMTVRQLGRVTSWSCDELTGFHLNTSMAQQ